MWFNILLRDVVIGQINMGQSAHVLTNSGAVVLLLVKGLGWDLIEQHNGEQHNSVL